MDRYQFSEGQRLIIEHSPVPFAVYQLLHRKVVTIALSGGFIRMLGFTMEEKQKAYDMMDNNMYAGTHPDDAARVADAALRYAEEGERYEEIYRARSSGSGTWKIIHAASEKIRTSTGEVLAVTWYMNEGEYRESDTSHSEELNRLLSEAIHEESILHANYYDYLTGLPSMTYFFELAEAGRQSMARAGDSAVMIFFDLNGMKFYNSRHGFAQGDELLKSFAGLLTRHFPDSSCCRVGQDHFAVVTKEDGIKDTIDTLFDEWEEMNPEDLLTVRAGIYRNDLEDVDASVACDRAKYACDSLRHLYESAFTFFDSEMLEEAQNRNYILDNFDRALEERWIEVYYQPIIRSANGRVCDEEALARWNDPIKGLISPIGFVPYLEEAEVIYKLDLYVVDRVIDKLKMFREEGMYLVPQSVNLSRTDFESCDMVEEITRRVDAAGFDHSLFSIEITESTVGSDYDFMKAQVERFREGGFPVWMDDFGSGYSSLDLLESIKFDVIKFDQHFMRQFNGDSNSRVVMTELMKMASALGTDTLCEGVETKEQLNFLREVGCTKIQGYYYGKPVPLTDVIRRFRNDSSLRVEDPRESEYFDSIGRINLYDLSMIANRDTDDFRNYFNSLPMVIIEAKDGRARFVRSNQSYREFYERALGSRLPDEHPDFADIPAGPLKPFMHRVIESCKIRNRSIVDATLPDQTVVHSFVRKIATNPVTGTDAIAIAVLAVTGENEGTTYANIARALAADYYNLFYVNLKTEEFIEYSSAAGEDNIVVERHSGSFFEKSVRDAKKYIYEADRERFLELFNKDNLVRTLDEQGSFTIDYRLMRSGEPVYVSMKAVRMQVYSDYIIIAVSNIDSQMKQRVRMERLISEQSTYDKLKALLSDFIVMYTVDPATDSYIQTSSSSDFEGFGIAESGDDFFRQSIINGKTAVLPDDYQMYCALFTKENVLSHIENDGLFTMKYHMMLDGRPELVKLRAAKVKEAEGERIVIGVNQIQD